MRKNNKVLVYHHNMFGPSCEVATLNNENDFKIYCYKEHKITSPKCEGCEFFGGSEMGNGVCCVWEETTETIKSTEHVVQHDEAYLEFQRVENPELYKQMIKMIEDGEIDICKVWQNID